MAGDQLSLFQRKTYKGITPSLPIEIHVPTADSTVLQTLPAYYTYLMDGLLGRANLWYCRQCRPGTSALTITGPTAFANGVNLELLRLVFETHTLLEVGCEPRTLCRVLLVLRGSSATRGDQKRRSTSSA
jgi:hypothetical protein